MGAPIGSRSRAPLSEINVTPLVDVMLVLLIMFMVTAPLMQQGLQVDLPKTKQTGMAVDEKPFVLVITAEKKILLSNQILSRAELAEKLKALLAVRPDRQVYLKADQSVPYGFVASVIAEIKSAGITKLGLVTLPNEGENSK